MDERTSEFLQYAMHVSELEEKCPCPKLFRIALDHGITLEDLQNELWKLTRMPEWEVKKYNVKPYQNRRMANDRQKNTNNELVGRFGAG